eukprot:162685_1
MTDSKQWQIVAICWLSIFLLAQITIIVSLLCKLYSKQNSHKPISPFYKYVTIICVTFCALSTIVDLIHTTIAYIRHEQSSDTYRFGTIMTIADITYFIASISLYILIIGKLYLTFKSTSYRVSNKYIIFLSILIVTSVFCMTQYLITLNNKDTIKFLDNSVKFVYAVIINDFIIDISVLALFVYKLQQLLIDTIDIGLIHQNSDNIIQIVKESADEYDFQNSQKRLVALITRQSILGSIQIFFNCTFYFKVLVDRYTVGPKFPSDLAFQTSHCLRALENLVVIGTLYLNFNLNTGLYYKICGCCHNGCYLCCLKCTKRKITKKTMDVYHRL